jgi:3-hydroxyisobutyrate dehydrogenase-like beta-hydroxyacid dehydrogenase
VASHFSQHCQPAIDADSTRPTQLSPGLPRFLNQPSNSTMGIEQVAIVGSGQMGLGIAQICAQAGIAVTMVDVSADALDLAQASIAKSLDRLVQKETMSEADAAAVLGLIEGAVSEDGDYSALAGADLVIEAVPELPELKDTVLNGVAAAVKPDALIVSNTSSISMTKLAAFLPTERRAKFAGLHFFNPVRGGTGLFPVPATDCGLAGTSSDSQCGRAGRCCAAVCCGRCQ